MSENKYTQLITLVSDYVRSGNVEEAERALVAVADEQGDHALMVIAEAIPATDYLAILRNFDPSHETQLFGLTSPKKFCEFIGLEERYREQDHERLKGMINGVLFLNEDRIDEYLDEVGRNQDALRAFRDYFKDRHLELEHMAIHGHFDQNEFSEEFTFVTIEDLMHSNLDPSACYYALHRDGEWMQVAWTLRHQHIETFADILILLRRLHAAKFDETGTHMSGVNKEPMDIVLDDGEPNEESAL